MISSEFNYGHRCMEVPDEAILVWGVHSRRLEDRIRTLCAKVVAAGEEDLGPAISELQSALHQHNERLRKLAVAKLTGLWSSRDEKPLPINARNNSSFLGRMHFSAIVSGKRGW